MDRDTHTHTHTHTHIHIKRWTERGKELCSTLVNRLFKLPTINRYVLRLDFKFSRDDDFLISSGNPFHNNRPATQKAQSPYDLRRDTGTSSNN